MPAIRGVATTRAPRKKAASPSDPCPVCGKRVGRQSDLKRHIDQHVSHEEKRFRCPHCPYRTNNLCAYNCHTDKHDGVLYSCPSEDCDRKFSDKATRSRHFTKFHKGGNNTKKSLTSQTVNTVRQSRVPATVRREIKQEDNETYSLFSQFASGAQLPALDASREHPKFSHSDTESDSAPSTPSSHSPLTPAVNVDVGYMFNDQYFWPETCDEIKFEPLSQDILSQWRLNSECEVPSTFLDVDYTNPDPSNEDVQFSDLPSSLDDFSCDYQPVTNRKFSSLKNVSVPQATEFADPGLPILKEEVQTDTLPGLFLTPDASYSPVLESTTPAGLSFDDFDPSLSANDANYYSNSWTSGPDDPLDFDFFLNYDPAHM